MTNKIPVLPIAGATLGRAFLTVLAFLTRWLKSFARARRHRREAATLARLDRRMLADIGISRSDVDDAFSVRFWEDPTALLNARASERRTYRDTVHRIASPSEQAAFRHPPIDRRVRYTF